MHQGALLIMPRRGLDLDGLHLNGLGWLDSAIPTASLILSCQAVQTTLDHYVWQSDLRQCFFLTESAIFGIAAPHAVGLCVTRFKIFPLYKAERSKTLTVHSLLAPNFVNRVSSLDLHLNFSKRFAPTPLTYSVSVTQLPFYPIIPHNGRARLFAD